MAHMNMSPELSPPPALGLADVSEEVAFQQETYGELRPFVRREWLLTNGIGGYASGTVVGVNTRRYHGLLIAATLPPVGRIVAASRIGEVLMLGDRRIDLSAAYFRNEIAGDGPELLRRFEVVDDVARWEYDIDGTKVFRELFVCWGKNASALTYRVQPGEQHRDRPISLHLSPFVGLRDFHALRHTGEAEFHLESADLGTRVSRRDLTVCLTARPGLGCDEAHLRYDEQPDWWYAHSYPMETARGLDDREDLFTPGTFSLDGTDAGGAGGAGGADGVDEVGRAMTLWITLDEPGELNLEAEQAHRREAMRLRPMPTPTQRKLVRAAADFVVKRRLPDGMPGTTVIAGYPWFSDWGRDTFIALPGLLLTTGRHQTAGQVLSTFAHYVSEGMIPNHFDDYSNEPSYNTVDASLWFIHAAHAYLAAARDHDTYESILRPACEAIIEGYTRGTRFDIGVDPADGLVAAGDETTQLTWMDAKFETTAFSPRHGKAVEINALWYHALCLLGETKRAEQVKRSFIEAFWLGEDGLADVVNGSAGKYERDSTIRPNQIFAVSLEHSPLDRPQQHTVVDVVRRELLTPFGLRTLSRGHKKFISRYTGPMYERDQAYHNGTVWPWLIGPFLEAHLRINDHSPQSIARARTWLRPLIDHLEQDGCLGSISEVFDAEYPYRPGGAFAQAWSVAEVLRLAVELDL